MLFSLSVMSDSLQTHGLQHTRLPCSSLSSRVCSNSCPLCQWYHSTISFSVGPFSSYIQSFPASGSFPMSWLLTSGGQSIGFSASGSVLSINIQSWFPDLISFTSFDWFDLFAVQGTIKGLLHHQFKSILSSVFSLLYGPFLRFVPYSWKHLSFDYMDLMGNVMSLFFNTLSRFQFSNSIVSDSL